jgi:EspA/EspE family
VKVIGELIEGIAGRVGLKNVREVGERLTKSARDSSSGRAGDVAGKLLDALGSDLLDFGQAIIAGLKDTTGQGEPDKGELFGQARSRFDGVNDTLNSAVPIDWDGSGSYAYADQNTRQRLRSEAMADADHQVHKVLFREAAQITLRRGYLDDQYNFLANTSYVTFPLQFIPRYGEAMKMAIEIRALLVALGESYYQMTQLRSEVAQNAADLQEAVGRYSGVADGAELPGAALSFGPPPPPPGGGGLDDAPASVGSPQIVVPGGAPRLSISSGGTDSAPAVVSGPTMTPDETTRPGPQRVAAGLPPLPQVQVPPLGALPSPLGAVITGAAPAAGQLAATPANRHTKKARHRVDEPDDDKHTADDEDAAKAASGDGESERAPLHTGPGADPAAQQGAAAARLDSNNPPGPPVGPPPQAGG